PEVLAPLLHPPFGLHAALPEAVDLLVRERALLPPAERLPFHQLSEQLDERQHELRQTLFPLFGIGIDAARHCHGDPVELACHAVEVGGSVEKLVVFARHSASIKAKLYGRHGPVQTKVSPGRSRSASSTSAQNDSPLPRGRRYAALSRSCGLASTLEL